MIIFFYGGDTFRSRKKLNDIKDKFKREIDSGLTSFATIDGKTANLKDLNDKLGTRSLLAKRRLIVVEDIFSAKTPSVLEEVLDYLKKIKEDKDDNILVFRESSLRTKKFGEKKLVCTIDASGKETPLAKNKQKLFDFLASQPYTQEFKPLLGLELESWVKKNFESRGFSISAAAVQVFLSIAGNNLWQLSNDIAKLTSYKAEARKLLPNGQEEKNKVISPDDIKEIVRGEIDENIFALTDAISSKNKSLAIKLLDEQYRAGLTDSYLLTMIIRQFKILIQIRQALDQRFTSRKMATSLKLHQFIIQKGINQVRNFSLARLKNIFSRLVEIDYLIKTGQGEAKTLLYLFIQKM